MRDTREPFRNSMNRSEIGEATRKRCLAKFAYRLACAGSLAFLTASFWPVNPRAPLSLPALAAWCGLYLFSPSGAIIGATLLVQIRFRSRIHHMEDVWYSAAAVMVGLMATVVVPIGTVWLIGLRQQSHAPRSITCFSNLKQLGLGIEVYAQDYDDKAPLAHSWNEELYPYMRNTQLLRCPDAPYEESRPTYAMNGWLRSAGESTIENPGQTIMLFDSIPGANLAGGPELFPDPPRHYARQTVAFVDGHVRALTVSDLTHVVWRPEIKPKPRLRKQQRGMKSQRRAKSKGG